MTLFPWPTTSQNFRHTPRGISDASRIGERVLRSIPIRDSLVSTLVSFVGHGFQKRPRFVGAAQACIEMYPYACVGVGFSLLHEAMSHCLALRIAVGTAALGFVADAPIEIGLAMAIPPKGRLTRGEKVVDELRHGAMQTLHHFAQGRSQLRVAQDVIVVGKKRHDPRRELRLCGVVGKAVPEDFLRRIGAKGGESVSTPGGNEINLIVRIPVFKAMTPISRGESRFSAFLDEFVHDSLNRVCGMRRGACVLAKATTPLWGFL